MGNWASDTYIIYRHILPNVTPILFADITLGVVGAILSESGFAFLGLTDPNAPSWGRMLTDAQSTGGFSAGALWMVVFLGMMITTISLALTFVGYTLDQVLNPRVRERWPVRKRPSLQILRGTHSRGFVWVTTS